MEPGINFLEAEHLVKKFWDPKTKTLKIPNPVRSVHVSSSLSFLFYLFLRSEMRFLDFIEKLSPSGFEFIIYGLKILPFVVMVYFRIRKNIINLFISDGNLIAYLIKAGVFQQSSVNNLLYQIKKLKLWKESIFS